VPGFDQLSAAGQPRNALTLKYVKRFDLQLDPFWPESGSNVFLWRESGRWCHRQGSGCLSIQCEFTPEERKVGFGGLEDKYLKPLQKGCARYLTIRGPWPQMAELGDISLGDYLHKQGASADAIQALSLGFERDSLLDLCMTPQPCGSQAVEDTRWERSLPFALAKMVASKIRYGAEVVRLEQKDDGVVINYTSAGKPHSIKADRVICTLPFTVLRGIKAEPQWSEQKGARNSRESTWGRLLACSRKPKPDSGKRTAARLRDSRSTDGSLESDF